MNRQQLALATVVTLLLTSVFAGCVTPQADIEPEPSTDSPESSPQTSDSPTVSEPADTPAPADSDAVGTVNGVRFDAELGIQQSDGLSDAEFDRLVDRTMARVEYLRNESFHENVTVTVRSRDEFQSENPFAVDPDPTRNKWNNQLWAALFIVDQETDIAAEFERVYRTSVQGYYLPATDELVVISSDARLQLNELTLAHELAHALQDQRFDLTQSRYQPETQDAQLATTGLIEGEASYIEQQYRNRCDQGEWECLAIPTKSGPGGPSGNIGIQILMYQPYSDGPAYVRYLQADDGWEAVDAAFHEPPTQTTEIIHLDQSPVESRPLPPLPERTSGWQRYTEPGSNGSTQIGEAGLFVMLWYQASQYNIETIPATAIYAGDSSSRFSYVSTPTEGLLMDELVLFTNGAKQGYIWRLQWNGTTDAAEFRSAYTTLLTGHGAERIANETWVIEDGGYAGTYYVSQQDDLLTIVNAPRANDLHALYPPAAEDDIPYSIRYRPSDETLRTIVIAVLGTSGLVFLGRDSI